MGDAYRAVWDFSAGGPDELSLRAGDAVAKGVRGVARVGVRMSGSGGGSSGLTRAVLTSTGPSGVQSTISSARIPTRLPLSHGAA